ncbi:MAG: TonB C-terminal domain-containing protein [Bdellovibrionales bacterium]|nr:TonB C-terminal domain-containing protein [Bdellovibrionales bacterium]
MTQNKLLARSIRISLVLHSGLALAILLKGWISPSEPKVFLPSLRVDLVGLPDLKRSEIPAPAPIQPIEKKEALPPPPAPSKTEITPETEQGDYSTSKKNTKKKQESRKEKDAQTKLKRALDRIKALERVKALAGEDEIKGNQVSKGSALSGEAKQALETSYFDVVLERVRTYWELPKWLQDQGRSAKVMIYLDSQGRMKSFHFVQASGSDAFDQEVKRTLQAANPFSVPPSAIAGEIGSQGILLGFPL